jgi:hypothetical protein
MLRRSLLTVQCYYRAKSFPHNRNKNFLVAHPHHNAFLLRESPETLLGSLPNKHFRFLPTRLLPFVSTPTPLPVPHWPLSPTTFNLHLSVLPKATTPPAQYRKAFLHFCSKYQGAAIFFSDGAKSEDGVGVGIYHDQNGLPHASIYNYIHETRPKSRT